MNARLLRAAALPCALLTTTCLTSPAAAQNMTNVAPAVRTTLDGNGVDLATGTLNLPKATLGIGSGSSSLSYLARIESNRSYTNLEGFITISGATYTVSIGGSAVQFTLSGGAFTPVEASGHTLQLVQGTTDAYQFDTADGTTWLFQSIGDPFFTKKSDGSSSGMPMVTHATRPNGERLVFTYHSQTVQTGMSGCCTPILATGSRVTSVQSNYGYQIRFYYQSSSVGSVATSEPWRTVTKVRAINTAIESCNADPGACSTTTTSWPTLQVAWNATSRIQTYTDALQRQTRFYYNGGSQGLLSAIRLPGSSTDDVTIGYDANNRVSSVNRKGLVTGYAYSDSAGVRTTTVTHPGSATRVLTFDIAKSVLLTDRDETNRTTSYQYDANNRLQRITAPDLTYTAFTRDGRGNVTETRRVAPGTGLADIVTSAAFPTTCVSGPDCNKPSSTTDARGKTTTYYYSQGELIVMTLPTPDPAFPAPQLLVNPVGLQATYYDENGTWTTGLPITLPVTRRQCRTTAWCEDGPGETKSVTTYDTSKNLVPVSVATGAGDNSLTATVAYAYDHVRNLVSVDGALPGAEDTTFTRYDALRRPVGTISPDPDGAGALKRRAARTTYNLLGQVTKTESGTVNGTSDGDWAAFAPLAALETSYDSADRPEAQRATAAGATQAMVQFGYDASGRLACTAQRMDPATFGSLLSNACIPGSGGSHGPDRVTKTTYDAAGRVTAVHTGVGTGIEAAAVLTSHTPNGQTATVTDGENNLTKYEYDGHGRLSKALYPVATKGAGAHSTSDYESYSHDAAGNVTQRRLRSGQLVNFAYDDLGRLKTKDLPGTEPDVTYTYDSQNRLMSATKTGSSLSFAYDALGRNISQTGAQGTTGYSYDAAGRRTQMNYGGGLTIDYDYLVTGEVARIRENGATSGVGVLATYAYDDLGRRTSLTRGNGTAKSYGYDAASRLSSMGEDLAGTGADLTLGFTYNPASQIATTTRSNDSYAWTSHYNLNRNYTANGLNQYTASGSVAPTYDARGNLTSAGTTTYGYSSENLLTSTSGGVALSYDSMLRLQQTSGGSAGTTRFAYDGLALIAEHDGSNALLRRYVHGPGVDEPLVWYEGSGTSDRRWLHADERGSVIAVSNSAGATVATNAFDEYGIPKSSNIGRFQYTGQIWLPELGMYHYKARIYSPTLGRFLQTDPIGYGAGMNLYAYVGGDPVNWKDPLGLEEEEEEIVITGFKFKCPGGTFAARGMCYSSQDDLGGMPSQTTLHILGQALFSHLEKERQGLLREICKKAKDLSGDNRVRVGIDFNAGDGAAMAAGSGISVDNKGSVYWDFYGGVGVGKGGAVGVGVSTQYSPTAPGYRFGLWVRGDLGAGAFGVSFDAFAGWEGTSWGSLALELDVGGSVGASWSGSIDVGVAATVTAGTEVVQEIQAGELKCP